MQSLQHTHTGSPSTKKTCNHSLEKTSKNLHKCKFSKSSGINSKRTCLLLSSETLLFCCLWAKDQSQPTPNYQIFFYKTMQKRMKAVVNAQGEHSKY